VKKNFSALGESVFPWQPQNVYGMYIIWTLDGTLVYLRVPDTMNEAVQYSIRIDRAKIEGEGERGVFWLSSRREELCVNILESPFAFHKAAN